MLHHLQGTGRADVITLTTGIAIRPQMKNLRIMSHPFRVVTPPTIEPTAFEKNSGSYAWSIEHRKILDIRNYSCNHIVLLPLDCVLSSTHKLIFRKICFSFLIFFKKYPVDIYSLSLATFRALPHG
jgi:hypothetical protein